MTKGISDIDKTALSLALWMTVIVGFIAWKTHGDPMAICFSAGLPIGVFAFWLVFRLGKKMEEREAEQKKRHQQKAMAAFPKADPMPARIPYTPVTAAPVHVAKMTVDTIVSAALEPELPTTPFDIETLNELNYLYRPSRGRESSTLFVGEDSSPSLRPGEAIPAVRERHATMDRDFELDS